MRKLGVVLAVVLGFVCGERACAMDPVDEALLLNRIQQLESETVQLRSELQGLRPPARPVGPTLSDGVPAIPAATSSWAEEVADEEFEYFTWGEIKAEMKNLAWQKGDYRVVPYGILWGSASYETDRTSPGAYTLFVPSRDLQGEDAFVIDTRRTRIGLDIAGPKVPLLHCAESGGKIEIDFHGAFEVENKPGVLLRHAYGQIKNDDFLLLAGQTWDVVSPLYPHTISYSVGWGGGNIGYRRMQIRLERYLQMSDRLLLTLQGSINQNIVSDFNASPGVSPESTDWPLIEGRVATALGCDLPMVFGVSGHIGEQGFDFIDLAPPGPVDDARVKTWSLNADVKIPIYENLGFQGEFFTGSDLSTFLGGIVQGVDRVRRDGIRSTGGWCEVWYDHTPRMHMASGFGIDDPFDDDITSGRVYNQFVFINTTYDVLPKLTVGVEATYWKTMFKTAGNLPSLNPGEAVRFEFSGAYAF